ncbi:MAG: tyrosine-type recombinase/integrase [Solirubrobacteraceae bacterium]
MKAADGRKIRSHWTASKAEAVAWRQEAVIALRQGRLRRAAPTTVQEAGDALIVGMRTGAVLDRSGKAYKPKTVRTYEHALRTYVYPLLGHRKVGSLRRADVQGFIEEMRAGGASPSTVHNRLDPLRVILRRAIDNDELMVDPCARLNLPVIRNNRTRIEAPAMAEALIAALPESEQAFWALAFYAGLRRGELRALRVDDVDFESGLVRVRRGWDDVEGEIAPKSFAGKREVPMMGELRRICRAHKLQTGRHGAQLFLGRTPADPFYPSTVRARARKAWSAAGLEPLTAHEARHCAASYMIACGLDWKKVSEFIGHTDVRTTFNRYGKVVEEDLSEAAERLDAYFARHRDEADRGTQVGTLMQDSSGSQRVMKPAKTPYL